MRVCMWARACLCVDVFVFVSVCGACARARVHMFVMSDFLID